MAISYTNIWYDYILSNIRLFLRNEFKGAISINIGEYKSSNNEMIRLVPLDSRVINTSANHVLKEYSVGVYYYYSLKNIQHNAFTEHILKRVSRIEGIFHDNLNKNHSTGVNAYFEGILEGVLLDAPKLDEPEDFEGYIARWEFTCKNLGNIS